MQWKSCLKRKLGKCLLAFTLLAAPFFLNGQSAAVGPGPALAAQPYAPGPGSQPFGARPGQPPFIPGRPAGPAEQPYNPATGVRNFDQGSGIAPRAPGDEAPARMVKAPQYAPRGSETPRDYGTGADLLQNLPKRVDGMPATPPYAAGSSQPPRLPAEQKGASLRLEPYPVSPLIQPPLMQPSSPGEGERP